jgi:hypothetical protein
MMAEATKTRTWLIIHVKAHIVGVRLLAHYVRIWKYTKQWIALFEGSHSSPACPSDNSSITMKYRALVEWNWQGIQLGKTLIPAPNDPIPIWQGPTSDRPRLSAVRTGIDCRPEMHLHNTNWVSISWKTQSLHYKYQPYALIVVNTISVKSINHFSSSVKDTPQLQQYTARTS